MSMDHEKFLKEAGGDEELADKLAREATGIDCSGDVLRTKQEFKEDADINVIISRCVKDPNVASLYAPRVAPVFGDVSEIPDLRTAMERQLAVDEAFMSLPAKVRERFAHDPMNVLTFIKDESNYDEAVKLGLVLPRKVEEPPAPKAPPAPSVSPAEPPAVK